MPLLAVNHHYFRQCAPSGGIYPVSASTLRIRMQQLKSHYRLIGEGELAEVLSSPQESENLCVATFDDGLKEQMGAAKVLKEIGGAAICFVPAAPLVKKIVLDVHKLHMVRSTVSDTELAVDLRRFGFDQTKWDEEHLRIQYRYDTDESRKVKYFLNFVLDPEQRRGWLNEIFTSRFGDEAAVSESLYMGRDDVRILARDHSLGTHAYNHVPLADLDHQALEREIADSIDVLEQVSQVRVKGISYPFGGKSAVSSQVFDAAKASGLSYGFTMERGVNTCDDLRKPFQLKRIDTNDVNGLLFKNNGDIK